MLRCSATFVLRLLAIAACGAVLAVGAGPGYSHRVWGLEDGLPNGRIQAITQTSDGYLWVGTAGGLVRFDGQRFVIFDRSNTPGLTDDSILSLLAVRDGSLWAGTEGGGVVQYKKGAFTRYSGEHGLTNLFVRSLYEDRGGSLWVGTDRGLFHKVGERFLRLDGTPAIPFVNALYMVEDGSGDILIGGNGLYRVHDGVLLQESKQRGARSILPRPDGSRWVATFDGIFDWRGDRVLPIYPELSSAARLLTDEDGVTWIGAETGLFVLADGLVLSRYLAPGSLPDESVLALYCDRERNLWVGTRNGLARLSKRLVSSHTGAGDHAVFSIYKDRRNTVWVVGGDGAVYEVVQQRLTRRHLAGLPADLPVRTLFQGKNGCMWVGTANEGFFRTRCGAIQTFNMAAGLRSNSIRSFVEDRAGQLWIGTGSGLVRLDRNGLKVFYTDEGLAYGSVRSLLEDRNGDLWVGTDGGLSRMRDGQFRTSDPAVKALAGERIWALHQDSTGAVWVGTRGRGLFRIVSGAVTQLPSESGLPRTINQILEDASGTVWMSGASGVIRTSLNELHQAATGGKRLLKVLAYGSAEGMPSIQMSGGFQPAGVLSADGKVWFASIKGAVTINTDSLPSTHVPTAIVEQVLVDGRAVDFEEVLSIPAGTARLDVHFTAPSLLSPERVQFWYKLENFDRDWAYTSTNRSASYTSLPPGQYTFRLISRNLAAPDRPSEASVRINWEPRFSQTVWAWAVASAGLAALVWVGFWFYARQTKQRYAVMIAERARLAREMHDTVIQGCVGVSSLLEAASSFEKSNASMLVDLMNRARREVRLTLEEARQAVWDLRHDSMGVSFDKRLAQFAQHLSDEAAVPIGVEIVGDPVELDWETDRNLFAATREAVRNAVTHGRPNSVKVLVGYSANSVRIEVIDDGIGFEAGAPRIAAGHYGLLGMRERMEQLGGSLRLLSDHARGTRVIAELPLGNGGRG
ncbi:MAG TPA: two-component regulator propeller domain-containing protein [Bryobacteraceae bacterium]|nr:two-component regulator propeller domain-containing protein [Bryobacteraceae bacterium]